MLIWKRTWTQGLWGMKAHCAFGHRDVPPGEALLFLAQGSSLALSFHLFVQDPILSPWPFDSQVIFSMLRIVNKSALQKGRGMCNFP